MLVCACRVWSSAPSCPVARVLARPPVCGCGFAPCFPVFPVASCTHVLGCCSVAARLLPGCYSVAARLLLGCCSVAARLLTVQPARPCGCGFGESLVVWGALPPPSPPTAAALRLRCAWLWGREGLKRTNLLRPAQLQLADLALTDLAESLTDLALTDLRKPLTHFTHGPVLFLAGLP